VTPEEREALLSGYALGSLSEPDARDAEYLIRSDPDAAREYQAYLDLADLIALSVPMRRANPAIRDQVIEAARRTPNAWRQRRHWKRYLPAAGLAAALTLVVAWGASLQSTIGDLRAEQAQLVALVEAEAKRLDALNTASVSASQAATLGARFETALRDQQVILAVQADPDAHRTQLEPTSAAHGAHGQYLWSDANSAGVLLVYDLPPLGFGDIYKLWLEDASSRNVHAANFAPDAKGDATVAIALEPGSREPVRLYLVASSASGTDGPVVLQATLNRDRTNLR